MSKSNCNISNETDGVLVEFEPDGEDLRILELDHVQGGVRQRLQGRRRRGADQADGRDTGDGGKVGDRGSVPLVEGGVIDEHRENLAKTVADSGERLGMGNSVGRIWWMFS